MLANKIKRQFLLIGLLLLSSGLLTTKATPIPATTDTAANIPVESTGGSEAQVDPKPMDEVKLKQEEPSVDEKANAEAEENSEHMATAIVVPLSQLAHITYDSEPITHKPNDHKPLFHREGHDELAKI